MAKRRNRGDGSLHLRKDGRWEGRYVVGYDDKGRYISGCYNMSCAFSKIYQLILPGTEGAFIVVIPAFVIYDQES